MGANLADLFEGAAADTPDADAVVVDGQRWSFAALDDRASRLATVLLDRGIGTGDRVGVLLGNTNEHLEVLLACFKCRATPVNLNTRFVETELAELVGHSRARLVVHEADLGERLPAGVDRLARGAEYEAAIAGAAPAPPIARSGDDPYVLYTGGTTDTPKGVVWRHADLRVAALAPDVAFRGRRMLVACPFFHGTGQWMALAALLDGGTVLTTRHRSIRPDVLWALAASERATHVVLVGDAYARPLVAWLEQHPAHIHLDELTVVLSGGATLTPGVVERLLRVLPDVMVVDGFGASETGGNARAVAVAGAPACRTFAVGEETSVLDDDLRAIPPHDDREGWLARRGSLPLGYDGDTEASARTFPMVGGVRWSIPGDRARWSAPGRVEILGRGELTINTGGEKVHPEEVEGVLLDHDAVADVVVVGTQHERWGEIVTAVVAPQGQPPTLDELVDHCRQRLAGFKVPRRLVVVDEVQRTAMGKPDYAWARSVLRTMTR